MIRLVLLAMKKHFNVLLDGLARQQKNVIEIAVREQGVKARLCVLHFGEELFATVGAAKHGYDALNMRNVFRKIPRRESDVAGEGQWRRVVELRLQFIIALYSSTNSICRGGGAGVWSMGKSMGAVNSLKSAASGLTPAKWEANFSLREATTLTQVFGSTSSDTQAARRGKCSN